MKNQFNLETYKKIHSFKSNNLQDTERWYSSSYTEYIHILETNKLEFGTPGFYDPSDFVLAASFAFSWLARIPRLNHSRYSYPFGDAAIVSYFFEIDRGNFDKELDFEIVSGVSKNLDNSIVAVSKMFHFLSPNYFPIIDSKVITAWNDWFPEYKLPKKITVQKYLLYADLMREWSKNTAFSLRELEVLLFHYEK
jgi:hypothetical protein